MFILIFQIVVLIAVNTIFYYQAKKYGANKNHHILLVSVPEKEYDNDEVQNIVSGYHNELLKRYLLTYITYIPILFLSKLYLVIYYLVIMWANIIFINLTLKKYRHQLLELKKKNNWPSIKSKTIKIDLKLSALMEQKDFHYKKYLLVLLLDCICLGCMLYFHSPLDQYPFLAIQLMILGGGLYCIKKCQIKHTVMIPLLIWLSTV